MAAPYPPQGQQEHRTERPLQVYAEQYLAGQPLPVGAVLLPELHPDGLPRVMTDHEMYVLHETDWVISNRYSGQAIDVISAEEFAERFGPSAREETP